MTTTTLQYALPLTVRDRLAITIVPGIASETQILIEATLPQLILSSVEVQQLADLCAVITDDLRIWHQGGMEISDVYAQEQMVDRLLPLKRIERDLQRAQSASLAVLDGRVVLSNPLQEKQQALCPACYALWQQQNQERAEVLQQEADV